LRRQQFLLRLSREHHHGLVLARRAVRAAEQGPDAVVAGWEAVREAHRSELVEHFRDEESRVLPLLGSADDALVSRTLREHDQLRALIAGGATADELRAFGELLARHIRFEERQLFPAIERLVKQAS
jgi:hemerythrin-like domain-containing protein